MLLPSVFVCVCSYEESLNNVLLQECTRFNKLSLVVQQSLSDLQKALKGTVVMSAALEEVADALALQRIPALWAVRALYVLFVKRFALAVPCVFVL